MFFSSNFIAYSYNILGDTMNYDIEEIRKKIKNKRKINSKKNKIYKTTNISIFFSKVLITVVLTLITLIILKNNNKYKTIFYKEVYEKNISFATINEFYQKYFGSPLPFKNLFKDETKMVFSEKLQYNEQSKYLDGVKLIVDNNYLVPILESGMVVFIGEKEGYGNTVIIQQMDGIDVWYGNIDTVNVKLYDYVEKGNLLGEVNSNELYLVFKKNGEVLKYEEHI